MFPVPAKSFATRISWLLMITSKDFAPFVSRNCCGLFSTFFSTPAGAQKRGSRPRYRCRLAVRVLNALCDGSIDSVLVLGEASWPRGCSANRFDEACSARRAVRSSCAGASVPLCVCALRTVRSVSVGVQIRLVYPDLPRHRRRCCGRRFAARLALVLELDLHCGAFSLRPWRYLDLRELLGLPAVVDRRSLYGSTLVLTLAVDDDVSVRGAAVAHE